MNHSSGNENSGCLQRGTASTARNCEWWIALQWWWYPHFKKTLRKSRLSHNSAATFDTGIIDVILQLRTFAVTHEELHLANCSACREFTYVDRWKIQNESEKAVSWTFSRCLGSFGRQLRSLIGRGTYRINPERELVMPVNLHTCQVAGQAIAVISFNYDCKSRLIIVNPESRS